ncbi:uncharacterized protein LOC101451802 [Ceratitis capitata]|uniref:uncharacterized protein LOC101451802 n=1 Tax=Ceratitis capitata TaxID=7213 RepID=UPI0003297099|nr:uncharacterized protein LOC101451802 [Ceratitis capitata]
MLKHGFYNFFNHTIRNIGRPQKYLTTITANCNAKAEVEFSPAAESDKQQPGSLQFQNYTTEEKEKVLSILNNEDVNRILSYDIAKTRAAKLITWKKRNGPLKSIEDILLIEGFGLKVVDKFYKSILESNSGNSQVPRSARQRTAGFITPPIDVEHRKEIKSCLSLRIGVSSVSWARLELPETESVNEPCTLTHWQHHEITEKKMHLGDLVQRLLYVDHLIPKADCYLLENPQLAQINSNPGSVDQQNISVQKSQVIAVLAFALCSRERHTEVLQIDQAGEENNGKKSADRRSNVFYLRRFLTARLFSQLVGTERVSSEETVLQLMRTHFNIKSVMLQDLRESGWNSNDVQDQNLSLRGNVQFPQEHREMFSRAGRYQREFLGQSLLLNLAFVRLVLLQDEKSIATVTRTQAKTDSTQLNEK